MFSLLLRIFHCKFSDVNGIGKIVRTKITQTRILFIDESVDLNVCTFNENSGLWISRMVIDSSFISN